MLKNLIEPDEMGVMVSKTKEMILVDSRVIANYFEKDHRHVIRDIENLISIETDTNGNVSRSGPIAEDENISDNDTGFSTKSGLSIEFAKKNFVKTSYTDSRNRKQKCYLLTRDGFTVLVMGYTGKKAMEFKEAYIKRFNEMEDRLLQIQTLRDQYPMLTDAIKDTVENPQSYHYANEADMLNKIAFGMTAKQYRETYHIEKYDPIRPHLNSEQAALLEYLQHVDVGFVYSMLNFQQRKARLEWCAMKWREKQANNKKTELLTTDIQSVEQ